MPNFENPQKSAKSLHPTGAGTMLRSNISLIDQLSIESNLKKRYSNLKTVFYIP